MNQVKVKNKDCFCGVIKYEAGTFFRNSLWTAVFLSLMIMQTGCQREKPVKEIIVSYQESLSKQGALNRESDQGIGLIKQKPEPTIVQLEVKADPNTGKKVINLSIEQALLRALGNNPEIRITSFDPSIAGQEIIKALAEFDPIAFGSYNYENQDNPQDSIFLGGQSTSRLYQAGVRQKTVLGTEWSASYALVRNWDDLTTRTLSSRFEPVAVLQLRQPLLRDGGAEFNKAGIDIAKLNEKAAMASFRQVTEDIATRVAAAYWSLLQAKKDVEIQQLLLDQTSTTLTRIKDREGIDATSAQIKQAETYLHLRESNLIAAKKSLLDVQDALIQLLSDPQLGIAGDLEVVPVTPPNLNNVEFKQDDLLAEAMGNHPRIQQAKLGVEVSEINIKVAKNQLLPRLDFVGSARMNGMDRTYGSANDQLGSGDYVSWAAGVNLEVPLGNRAQEAELMKRKYEFSKAQTILYNTSDQVALQTKERLRLIERAQKDVDIQKKAVEAAKTYLSGLENLEELRPSLTPEFIFTKLQAQELLAEAERSEIKAIADFNIALVQLAQATGTVLRLHRIETSLQDIIAR